MCVQFTDDDLEKPVEDANGERIGTVTTVEGDVAQVEPRAGVMNSIRAALGWSRTRDSVSVRADAVDEITDDVIRLETESLVTDETGDVSADEGESVSVGTTNEPDETTAARPEADDAATRSAEPDPDGTEGADREASPGATEASATAEDLEDELSRGPKVEPPAESEVREAMAESTESVGGETTEMTDVPEELETGEAHGDTLESDPTAEGTGAGRSEPDEPDRSESPDDAEPTDVVDEPRGDEAFEADEVAAVAESAETGSAESESETAGDAESETEETDLADELERGPDLESVDAGDPPEPSPAEDVGDELSRGTDLESAAEPTDESPERPETEEMDLAGELDRGADLDAIEEDAPSETPDSGAREHSTEEMDLTEELDRGVDVEAATEAETDREEDAEADAFPGPRAEAESTSDPAAPRSMELASHGPLEAEPALDHRADEPAVGEIDADEPDRSDWERDDVESSLEAVFEAQQTAIEQSQRLLEDSLAVQRDVNRIAMNTLRGQIAFQRQGLEVVRSMTPDPVEATGVTEPPADERRETAEPEFERRLELVDGIDSMYRERLAEAGITSLDDLAYADAETVAEAAGVTEERAESWIEQASA